MSYGSGAYGAGPYGTVRRMSYNAKRDEVFISDGSSLSYVLNENGLYAVSAQLDDAVYHQGELLIHSPAAIVQDDITFSTDIINFNSNGLKALEWVNLGVDCPNVVSVVVRYRDSVKAAYSSAPSKEFNNEGYARIGVRGVDFILDFTITAFTSLHLDHMKLGVQFVDRRFRRGTPIE